MLRHLCIVLAATAAPVLAAELPPGKSGPAAVAAAVCGAYGTGFTAVAGTGTCVRVSGHVRAEYSWSTSGAATVKGGHGFDRAPAVPAAATLGGTSTGRRSDKNGIQTRGDVEMDTRSESGVGPVRSYIRLKGEQDPSVFSGSAFR